MGDPNKHGNINNDMFKYYTTDGSMFKMVIDNVAYINTCP